MQVALLVPEQEWRQLLADVQRLKSTEADVARAPQAPPPPPARIHTVREAAHYMRLKPEGVRNARRAGRLAGLRLNEKEWGFRQSELDRYLSRYNRRPLDGPCQNQDANRFLSATWRRSSEVKCPVTGGLQST